jgi:hypothetical protein
MWWTCVVHAQNACCVVWELLSLPALILSKGNISLSILVIIGNVYTLLARSWTTLLTCVITLIWHICTFVLLCRFGQNDKLVLIIFCK